MAPAACLSSAQTASRLKIANSFQQKSAHACASSLAFPKFQGLKQCIHSTANVFPNAFSFTQKPKFVQKPCVVAMAGTGKFFVGGNWKCNGTKESIGKLILDLNSQKIEDGVAIRISGTNKHSFDLNNTCFPSTTSFSKAFNHFYSLSHSLSHSHSLFALVHLVFPHVFCISDVVVSPPFVYLDQVIRTVSDRIEVAAQNSWVAKGGAFTGEVSAEMLSDIGVGWVILGHSERRHILKEDNDFVGKKEGYALSHNLKVIGCVGELLEEREAGKTFEVIFSQLKAMADNIPDWTNVVVAYEPVWAIGTGKVASPQQAQEVHAEIRKWMAENVSPEAASKVRIIYGGSVNAANCVELAKKEDIDGFLVGGASLKGDDFAAICNSVTAKSVSV